MMLPKIYIPRKHNIVAVKYRNPIEVVAKPTGNRPYIFHEFTKLAIKILKIKGIWGENIKSNKSFSLLGRKQFEMNAWIVSPPTF